MASRMSLYYLLNDRHTINLLKLTYDQEERQDKSKLSYTITLADAQKKLDLWLQPHDAVKKLTDADLVAAETVNGTTYISITNRGKAFIEVFDQLQEIYSKDSKAKKIPERRKITVQYNLNTQEKKMLLAATKLSQASGQDFIPLSSVVQELFPKADPRSKMSAAVQQAMKLEELQFVERKKEQKKALIRVTEKGYNSIKDLYEKGLML